MSTSEIQARIQGARSLFTPAKEQTPTSLSSTGSDSKLTTVLDEAGAELKKTLRKVPADLAQLKRTENANNTALMLEMNHIKRDLAQAQAKAPESFDAANKVVEDKFGEQVNTLVDENPLAFSSASVEDTNTPAPPEVKTTSITGGIADLIAAMKDNYVAVYAQAMEKYSRYFSGISDLVSLIGKSVKAGPDNTMIVDFPTILAAMKALESSFNLKENALFVSTLTDDAAQAEATHWAIEMGLNPANCVRGAKNEDGSMSYFVTVDSGPITAMITSTSGKKSPLTVQEFQAWQAGFDAQKNIIQTTVSVIAEKYGQANDSLNNMVKLFASITAAFWEAYKSFLS